MSNQSGKPLESTITPGNILLHSFLDNIFQEEKFVDTKGVFRSRQLKDKHYNGQKIEDKNHTNNGQQNTTQKMKDGATRAPYKQG